MKVSLKQLAFGILSILVIVETYIIFGIYRNQEPPNYIDPKVDSLINIVDSLKNKRDTLLIEILKKDTIIEHVKEQYSKDSLIIATQSVNEDVEFFSNFLSTYNK